MAKSIISLRECVSNRVPGVTMSVLPVRYQTDFEDMGELGRGALSTVRLARGRLDQQTFAVKLLPILLPKKLTENCPFCGMTFENYLTGGFLCKCRSSELKEYEAMRSAAGAMVRAMLTEMSRGVAIELSNVDEMVRYYQSWVEPSYLLHLVDDTPHEEAQDFVSDGSEIEVAGWVGIVMEPLDDSLEQRILSRVTRPAHDNPLQDVVTVLSAAMALLALHSRGIYHNNIRPGNILIDADGSVRLSGLGPPDMGAGLYTAPEQCGTPSAQGDVYSLGMVLLRVLLPQATAEELLFLRNSGSFQAFSSDDAGLHAFYTLSFEMTDCDPHRRPALTDIIVRLDRLLAGYSVQ